MRIVRLFLALVIIAGVAYYYMWNKHAVQTHELFEQKIVELNTKYKGADGVQPDFAISYESAERSGFPFGVSLALKNPKVSYSSHFTKNAFMAIPQKEGEGAPAPLYTHISLKGDMQLNTNYFTRTLDIIPTGRWTSEMPLSPEDKGIVMMSELPHTDKCQLTLNKNAAWSVMNNNFFEHIKSMKDVVDNFEKITCSGDGYRLMDQDNGDVLIALAPYEAGFTSKSMDEDLLDVNVRAQFQEIEFSETYIAWYKGYIKKLYTSMYGAEAAAQMAGLDMMASGKQLIDIDIDIDMPKKPGTKLAEKTRIKASSFKMDNVMYKFDLPFSYSLKKTGSKADYSFNLEGDLEFKETMRASALPLVKSIVLMSSYKNAKTEADRKKIAKFSHEVDANPEILTPLVPKLDELGKITFDFDLVADATKDEAGFENGGKLNVKSANITNELYGIRSGGEFGIGKMAADFVLRINGGDLLIDDVVGYLKRLHEVAPVKAELKYEFNDLIAKKMQSLFAQISTTEDLGATWVIHLQDNGQNQLVVNGKPMLELMMLAVQTFSPQMNVHRYSAPQYKVKRPSAE